MDHTPCLSANAVFFTCRGARVAAIALIVALGSISGRDGRLGDRVYADGLWQSLGGQLGGPDGCDRLDGCDSLVSCDSICGWGSPSDHGSVWDDLPNMIGDPGVGIPRVFGTATQVVHFPDHFSKASQNNSALLRNRFYFDYSHLSSMTGTSTTGAVNDERIDGNVFRFGLERLFGNDQFAWEVIVPFTQGIGSEVDDANFNDLETAEFGNVVVGLKSLLYQTNQVTLTSGVRVEIPTREDQEGITAGVTLERDTWFFQPYVATAFMSDGWFAHGFTGVRLRDSEDEGFLGSTPLPALNFVTRDTFYADLGIGRVLTRPCGSLIRSIAPTVELHYLQTIEGGDPALLTEAIYGSDIDRLNLTLGVTTQWANDTSVALAVLAPLRTNEVVTGGAAPGLRVDTDREAEFQLALQLNRWF